MSSGMLIPFDGGLLERITLAGLRAVSGDPF